MKYKILQIKDINNDYVFMRWSYAKKLFNINDYALVYTSKLEGEFTDLNALDELFKIFNYRCPEDFNGHSLSVSDIVVLIDEDGRQRTYYCDFIGWEKINENFHCKMDYDEMIEYLLAELEEEKNKMLNNEENKFGYIFMLCNDMGIVEGW